MSAHGHAQVAIHHHLEHERLEQERLGQEREHELTTAMGEGGGPATKAVQIAPESVWRSPIRSEDTWRKHTKLHDALDAAMRIQHFWKSVKGVRGARVMTESLRIHRDKAATATYEILVYVYTRREREGEWGVWVWVGGECVCRGGGGGYARTWCVMRCVVWEMLRVACLCLCVCV